MRPVFMDLYSVDILRITVPADMSALVYDEDVFAPIEKFAGADTAEQSRAHYEIIVPFHLYHLSCI